MKNISVKKKYIMKPGSALALTMFILAGMLMVAMSGSTVILLGLKAAGIQSQSTKAYFAAEAGTERILWELNKNGKKLEDASLVIPLYNVLLPRGGETYAIYCTHRLTPIIFTSIGEYKQTKRSVQVSM